jgi:hypothetical protein
MRWFLQSRTRRGLIPVGCRAVGSGQLIVRSGASDWPRARVGRNRGSGAQPKSKRRDETKEARIRVGRRRAKIRSLTRQRRREPRLGANGLRPGRNLGGTWEKDLRLMICLPGHPPAAPLDRKQAESSRLVRDSEVRRPASDSGMNRGSSLHPPPQSFCDRMPRPVDNQKRRKKVQAQRTYPTRALAGHRGRVVAIDRMLDGGVQIVVPTSPSHRAGLDGRLHGCGCIHDVEY